MGKRNKKKMDKFIQFKNRTNGSNYRNTDAIIEKFNKSIGEYKRFSEIYEGGDDELASAKLITAGTDLYMCCEWAAKNYLYRRYREQLSNQEITKQDRDRKTDELSKKTANLKFLLDELKNIGIPFNTTEIINFNKIISNARIVNNGPKHDGTIPDPALFKESLGEIRKIIRNYVTIHS